MHLFLMNMPTPYVHDDGLVSYYHATYHDAWAVCAIIDELLGNTPTFKTPIPHQYHHLLDFANVHADCQFALFAKICEGIKAGMLTWFVFGGDNPYLFHEFNPPMIAKTPNQASILQKVSGSFMQMQNGSYVVFDDNRQFYAIIVDGYYMVCLLHKNLQIENLEHYLDNWQRIDECLDTTTATLLKTNTT